MTLSRAEGTPKDGMACQRGPRGGRGPVGGLIPPDVFKKIVWFRKRDRERKKRDRERTGEIETEKKKKPHLGR